MKKEFVKCPICDGTSQEEACALATTERVEEEKVLIYCCKSLVERVKE